MQYGFDRKEHPISLNPHGNSKKENKAFSRTKASTLKMIKESVGKHKGRPIKILREIENEHGGIMEAHSSCDLPRNRRQIYNMKHSANVKKEKSLLPSSVPRTDTLACIMQMCKDTFSTTEAFIRSVNLCVFFLQINSCIIWNDSVHNLHHLFYQLILLSIWVIFM